MKAGWQTKTLGEICKIERGGSPRPIQNFITTDRNGINWIKIGDATASGKYIYKTEERIKPEGAKRSRMVYEGDFILSNSMSFGRPYIMKVSGCIHDGWLVLRQPKVDPGYLYHVLSSDLVFSQFDRLASGSTVRNLNIELAKSVEIPYPPLPEQQRIVTILDQAFAGIATAKANAEKNLRNARALFESHLQSVFTRRGEGWEEKKLGNVCRIARGGSPRPIQEFLTTAPDGINWIKISDATASGKYIYKTEQKIISDGARRSRMVHEGDFLLSNSMSFGRPYIMRTSGCVHDGWLILSDYASILHQDYLYYVLGSSFVYQQFDRLAAGSTVRNLNIELASRVEIPIPPLAHQQEIAKQFEAFSEKIQRLESVYQRKLAALDALKQSLLHQAFSGQL
jgi:type I restriction enzyme S subunit